MKNLNIGLIVSEVSDKGENDSERMLEVPLFIDKKDCSRPVINYLFLKMANILCDKLKIKKEHYDKIEKWKI